MSELERETDRLSDEQINSFREKGYLKIEGVFDEEEVAKMQDVTQHLLETYAGSTGDDFFERAFNDEKEIDRDELVEADLKVLYHLEGYSVLFRDLVFDQRIVGPVTQLIGPDVEFHVSSMHAKPPEEGAPFPMHQDSQFFLHDGDDYIDVFVHIDDAPSERGPIQFIEGSHKDGTIPHHFDQGEKYLPPEDFPFEDAVEVPAEAGDVVIMHYHTIHGSNINRSDQFRPILRMAYRNPQVNPLAGGVNADKVPILVAGERSNDEPVPGNMHFGR